MKIDEETSNINEEEEEEENSITIEKENEEKENSIENNIIENSLPTPINNIKNQIKSDYLINTTSNNNNIEKIDEESLQNFYSNFLTSHHIK